MSPLPFALTKDLVLLCEGQADQIFFERLLEARQIPDFAIPPHTSLGESYGTSGFGKSLLSLSGDPGGYSKIKGVLIIGDSAADVNKTFAAICKVIEEHGPFGHQAPFIKPSGPYELTRQPGGHPPISILLLPLNRAGALETLCADVICDKRPSLRKCVEKFLRCGEIKAMDWGPEKRDKARLQCLIAALHEEDPNKGLRHLLRSAPLFIDLHSPLLDPLAAEIKKFRDQALNI